MLVRRECPSTTRYISEFSMMNRRIASSFALPRTGEQGMTTGPYSFTRPAARGGKEARIKAIAAVPRKIQ